MDYRLAVGRGYARDTTLKFWENDMTWTTPVLKEVNCGMEINMYSPSEDGDRGSEPDLF